MPLPKPKKGESQDNFISRCMSNDIMNKEFPDKKQRTAVCFKQWKIKKNEYIPEDLSEKQLLDDWRVVCAWSKEGRDVTRPAKLIYSEIKRRDIKLEKIKEFVKELINKIDEKEENIYRGKKSLSELSGKRFVLEKYHGGRDILVKQEDNVFIAEKTENNRYIYDIAKYKGKEVIEEPWYTRKKMLKDALNKEEIKFLSVDKEDLKDAMSLMGKSRVIQYDGKINDFVII